MTIHVTQENIDNGTKKSCDHCPIAQAICEATGDHAVYVRSTRVFFWLKFITLPREAQQFITLFDQGAPVKPFSFALDYEPEGAE